jgi:hypothetical protein
MNMRIHKTHGILLGCVFIFSVLIGSGCRSDVSNTSQNKVSTKSETANPKDLKLQKKVTFKNGARPEVAATGDRVFVVYLDPSTPDRTFNVKIYNKDMTQERTTKVIVPTDQEYGSPTDIRIVKDGKYLFTFYETVKGMTTFLFGAKYSLDDGFARVAYTGPIAQSMMFKVTKAGDEKLDDPAPMVTGDHVYVMTRYKTSLAKEGETKYKIRQFDKELQPVSEFELDLSDYMDGEVRQSSLIYVNGYFYIVGPTTTTGTGNIVETVEWTAPSDIMLIKLDKDWKVRETKVVANEDGYTEGYVTGLVRDGKYFYMTYNRVILGQEFSSMIRIFDKDWNLVKQEKVETGAGDLRPSIFVTDDKLYTGNANKQSLTAEILVYYKGL